MTTKQRIEEWKERPDALGSESRVAILIGEVAAKCGEEVPSNVMEALRALSPSTHHPAETGLTPEQF